MTKVALTHPSRHFLTDLQPFICIAARGCSQVDRTFTSSLQWQEHMDSAHGLEWISLLQSRQVWYCDIGPSEHNEFPTANELEQHVKSVHGSSIPNIELAAMLKQNVLLSPRGSRFCPICEETADTIKPQDKLTPYDGDHQVETTPGSTLPSKHARLDAGRDWVLNHISQHLQDLAFLSLRYITDGDEDGNLSGPSQVSLPDMSSEGVTLPQIRVDDAESNTRETVLDKGSLMISRRSSTSTLADLSHLPAPEFDDPPKHESRAQSAQQQATQPVAPAGPSSDSRPPRKEERKPITRRKLMAEIEKAKVSSPFDAKPFLPQRVFDQLVTRENIKAVLKTDSEATVEFVQHKASRFFMILVSINVSDLVLAIRTLERFCLTDTFLPISQETMDDNCEEHDASVGCDHDPSLNAFHEEPWDIVTLSHFYDRQWEFLAPVFTAHKLLYDFHPKTVFPFTKMGEDRVSGAFSEVYEIHIEPSHLLVHPTVRSTDRQQQQYKNR